LIKMDFTGPFTTGRFFLRVFRCEWISLPGPGNDAGSQNDCTCVVDKVTTDGKI
jgi:hypothetical protein